MAKSISAASQSAVLSRPAGKPFPASHEQTAFKGGLPTSEKLMFSVNEAIHALGISRTTFYGLVAEGRLKLVKIGRRSLLPRASLEAFISTLQ